MLKSFAYLYLYKGNVFIQVEYFLSVDYYMYDTALKFSYFSTKTNVVGAQKNGLTEKVLLST